MLQEISPSPIEASVVPEHRRLDFLPSKLGLWCARFEGYAYGFMRSFCAVYAGGFWQFVELDNGGFFIHLDTACQFRLEFPNGYMKVLDAETAGIIISLYALNALCFDDESDRAAQQYHLLRDYALGHRESHLIVQAID